MKTKARIGYEKAMKENNDKYRRLIKHYFPKIDVPKTGLSRDWLWRYFVKRIEEEYVISFPSYYHGNGYERDIIEYFINLGQMKFSKFQKDILLEPDEERMLMRYYTPIRLGKKVKGKPKNPQ